MKKFIITILASLMLLTSNPLAMADVLQKPVLCGPAKELVMFLDVDGFKPILREKIGDRMIQVLFKKGDKYMVVDFDETYRAACLVTQFLQDKSDEPIVIKPMVDQ